MTQAQTDSPPQAFLKGVRVLEIADGDIGTAYAARFLAQLGAEAICLEPPTGSKLREIGPFVGETPDPEKSGAFFALNFNKRGLTLDLAKSEGRDYFRKLLAKTDVLVFSRDSLAKRELHLDADSLTQEFPSLIAACVSPFGAEGPWSDWQGGDLQISAAGGITVGTGRQELPLTMPWGVAAVQAGSAAVAGVLAALLSRQLDQVGDWIDSSATDVWATVHCNYIMTFLYRSVTGIRLGNRGGGHYPDSVLPCKDGEVLLYCIQIEQWIRFVKLMGEPEWTREPRYRDRRAMGKDYPDEVDNLIIPWLSQYTRDELWAMARENRFPVAPVYELNEVLNHPHLAERNYFVKFNWHGQDMAFPGLPYNLTNGFEFIARPSPLLGESNHDIYEQEFGLTSEEVDELKAGGVI